MKRIALLATVALGLAACQSPPAQSDEPTNVVYMPDEAARIAELKNAVSEPEVEPSQQANFVAANPDDQLCDSADEFDHWMRTRGFRLTDADEPVGTGVDSYVEIWTDGTDVAHVNSSPMEKCLLPIDSSDHAHNPKTGELVD